MEGRQVEEAMLAVLHTVLLHRSTGKFHYKKEGTYSIGTVGIQDVDCDFIDFTYVRVSSEELDRALRKVVGEFKVGGCVAQPTAGGPGMCTSSPWLCAGLACLSKEQSHFFKAQKDRCVEGGHVCNSSGGRASWLPPQPLS